LVNNISEFRLFHPRLQSPVHQSHSRVRSYRNGDKYTRSF